MTGSSRSATITWAIPRRSPGPRRPSPTRARRNHSGTSTLRAGRDLRSPRRPRRPRKDRSLHRGDHESLWPCAVPGGFRSRPRQGGRRGHSSEREKLHARVAVFEEMTNRGPADAHSPGDLPLADALLREFTHLRRMLGDRRRPTVRSTIFTGLSYPGFPAIAEDVSLEFGEDREHAGRSRFSPHKNLCRRPPCSASPRLSEPSSQ